MPRATTLALAATALPLPPKSAPSAKDHHSAFSSTIGLIVAA
jgi:hypothetical protein